MKGWLCSESEAADFLEISVDGLRSARRDDCGPRYCKDGNRIWYHVDDLASWQERENDFQQTLSRLPREYEPLTVGQLWGYPEDKRPIGCD